MSAAHLRAVPDPGPDEPDQGTAPAGERPPVELAKRGRLTPVHATAPAPDTDDVDQDDDHEETAADPPGWIPDLRPYCDPRPLVRLGPFAVRVGRACAPPLLRAAAAGLRVLGRGAVALALLLVGYLSGTVGKRGSIQVRFVVAGLAAYATVVLAMRYRYGWWITAGVLLAAMVRAGRGDHATTKAKKKGPRRPAGTGRLARAVARASTRSAPQSTPPDEPEDDTEETPAETPAEAPAGTPAEASPEAPPGPSREDVIQALHHLVGEGRGVLLTTLREHLGLPDTRAVRTLLDGAGIPHREGVRARVGKAVKNGPGVHREDFPPAPLPLGPAPGGALLVQVSANTNANNTANTPGEGAGEPDDGWTAEELAQGHRCVPDPAAGPSAWKIEYLSRS